MIRKAYVRRCAAAASASASGTATGATSSSSSAASTSSSSTEGGRSIAFPAFEYKPRIRYSPFFATKKIFDFMLSKDENIVVMASTYLHEPSGVQVTLIPLSHYAHPQFYQQVDSLCCQHESVLMEGRVPASGAPYSTLVPPRTFEERVRPIDAEDSEGWEPFEEEKYWQPFSWGVKGSPKFTVVHAADRYDYERLPWWASLRFNIPFFGSYAREKHCMDMIPHLYESGYKQFAVPWGLGHMPIFHDMLVDHGFEQVGMCSLIMWSKIDGDRSAAEWSRLDHQITVGTRGARLMKLCAGGIVAYYVLPKLISFSASTEEMPDERAFRSK